MKRILFINHTGGLAGGETVFLDAINVASRETNNKIYVIYAADGNDKFKKAISKLLINHSMSLPYRVLRNTPVLALRNFSFSVMSIFFLLFYCIFNRIDVIYSNTSVNVIGIIVARILRKKHIWHIHELSTSNYRWTPTSLDKLYKSFFLYRKNYSIFVSNATKLAWEQQIGKKIVNSEVLYSRYKEINIVKSPHTVFTFGFLGSLVANKNVNKLIDSFIKINNAQLLIGGNGDRLKSLKEQVSRSQMQKSIRFLDHVTDLKQFYSSIDVLVQVSLNESWGLVTLESINAGIPVVMTKETGLREILNNEQGCIFVDPNDTTAIMQTMKKIMEDKEFRDKIVENGQNILNLLNLNNNFDYRIKELLNEI